MLSGGGGECGAEAARSGERRGTNRGRACRRGPGGHEKGERGALLWGAARGLSGDVPARVDLHLLAQFQFDGLGEGVAAAELRHRELRLHVGAVVAHP